MGCNVCCHGEQTKKIGEYSLTNQAYYKKLHSFLSTRLKGMRSGPLICAFSSDVTIAYRTRVEA